MIYGIITLVIVVIIGLVMIVNHLQRLFYHIEIPAKIIRFKEQRSEEYPEQVVGYIPVVKFTVGGKNYAGCPKPVVIWEKPNYHRELNVRYDPQNPKNFSATSYTAVTGCILIVLAIVGIALIVVLSNVWWQKT